MLRPGHARPMVGAGSAAGTDVAHLLGCPRCERLLDCPWRSAVPVRAARACQIRPLVPVRVGISGSCDAQTNDNSPVRGARCAGRLSQQRKRVRRLGGDSRATDIGTLSEAHTGRLARTQRLVALDRGSLVVGQYEIQWGMHLNEGEVLFPNPVLRPVPSEL